MKSSKRAAMGSAIAVALIALGASDGAASTDKASRSRCLDAGQSTVAANSKVRIFRSRNGTFACRLPSGKPVPLGDQDQYPDIAAVRNARVSGVYVAYEVRASGRSGLSSSVNVRNVATRRQAVMLPSTTRAEGAAVPRYGAVSDLEVTGTGAVAWIVTNAQGILELRKSDHAGASVVSSGAIDPDSLAASGQTIYWTQDGVARSATLT